VSDRGSAVAPRHRPPDCRTGWRDRSAAQALAHLAAGEVKVDPRITSHVGLDEVPDAFARLADPERDAKIIVVP
jgi:threonine dehydrogenase-like Zn-dependent dehydrogenase